MKTSVYVEFYGEQIFQDDVVNEVKKIWKDAGNKPEALKKIDIYIKPEDDRVYYVLNDDFTGSFPIINTQNDF